MTSQDQSDVLPPLTIDDPPSSVSKQDPLESSIESTKSMETNEPIQSETPKRGGRKKRDEPPSDNGKDQHYTDTQPLFEQPIIVEGKRSRKPTSRLELTELTPPKKELSIPQGHGKPLGDIAYINFQITNAANDVLTRLRTICFGRRSTRSDLRKNLFEFKGFEFTRDSEEYQQHLANLTKLKNDQLQSFSEILGLTPAADLNAHAEQILQFLMVPVDEGKAIPERRESLRATTAKATAKPIEEDEDVDDKLENGDDDDDEIFNIEDEEEAEETKESDDDYIGSDDEIGTTNNDDPDDFVYQPGRKAPKRKSPLKRARSSTTNKRKRATKAKAKAKPVARPTRSTRTRSKALVEEAKVDGEIPAVNEPMSTNDDEKNREKTEQVYESESNKTIDPKSTEQTNSQPTTDAIPEKTVESTANTSTN